MNPTLVTVNTHSDNGPSRAVAVPLFLPDLDEVRALALRLHEDAQPYQGRAWGWEVTYEPEVMEPEAEVEVAKVFGTSPEFWLNLQKWWDVYFTQQGEAAELAVIEPLTVHE